MKKFYGLLLALFTLCFANAAPLSVEPSKPQKIYASEIFVPIGATGQKISLLDLSRIKAQDYELMTGRKMKFGEKVSLRLAQKELSHSIKADGSLNAKKFGRFSGESGFHLGGFALGFFLGLIGILIAYLIK